MTYFVRCPVHRVKTKEFAWENPPPLYLLNISF